MQHALHPILGKARVHGLAVNIASSGLCLNDPAELQVGTEGQLQVLARIRRRFLGLVPRQVLRVIGHLGPRSTTLLLPYLEDETPLRLRIVGLTPEYIAQPEVFVSIWGQFKPQFSGPPPFSHSA